MVDFLSNHLRLFMDLILAAIVFGTALVFFSRDVLSSHPTGEGPRLERTLKRRVNKKPFSEKEANVLKKKLNEPSSEKSAAFSLNYSENEDSASFKDEAAKSTEDLATLLSQIESIEISIEKRQSENRELVVSISKSLNELGEVIDSL
ncbi:hypothetical protein D0962_28370 [Leptolyngbyaceae cyanobacterium CCMR0082]|uniref:Uncharacterized protein n=1 Tax=Adonisia turfae CCMR0082 TaxID=2304604 RepID=A0A6M0SDR6_9CYAN|nr:hypothetical protein [Adonisia turfae]NEZ66628.1 hypothetical protein [Adonisia turfae CCMR0082]